MNLHPRRAFLLVALLSFLPGAIAAPAATRTLPLRGTLTNTTADASAPATLVLTIEGETVTARLETEPPLTGSGTLTGRLRNGWLELAGKLDEGFQLQLRGALNSRDYRGTYLAAVPENPIQYGKFHLTIAAP